MSGGVDSTVAAYLIKEQGYDCIGVTMKLYSNEDIGHHSRSCCSLDDVDDARRVAHHLGIPYYVFNFSTDFKHQVMQKRMKTESHRTLALTATAILNSTVFFTVPKSSGFPLSQPGIMRKSKKKTTVFC